MKLLNMTPHAIHVVADNSPDAQVVTIPASGDVVRVFTQKIKSADVAGLPIFTVTYGDIEGIPQVLDDDTYYVVSSMVLAALSAQGDSRKWSFLAPGDPVRDAEGVVIGCVGFKQPE